MRRLPSVLILCVFAAIVAFVAVSQSTSQPPTNETAIDFTGKYVTLYTNSSESGTGDFLKEVRIRQVAGKTVLTGIGVDSGHPEDWTAGTEIVVPWRQVVSMYLMTEKQFNEKIRERSLAF
ncbi:hypothetical protein [Roseiconus lacunae]|uniref:hypothetical protein n=1 Tax=Roseiconus lacunae TaxID=2605694 RepID=UPI0011F0D6D4|nr:hypothetical protein [Roseiconus lacunae]